MMFSVKMTIKTFKRKSSLLVIFGITVSFLFFWTHHSLLNDIDRKARLEKIDSLIKNQDSKLACRQPRLPVFSPEIVKFLRTVPDIDCSKAGLDWVKCRGSECVIQEAARVKYGPISCSFTDILRVNDYELTDGETTYSTEYYKLERSDVVRVSCKSPENKWSAILTGIRLDPGIWDKSSWEDMPRNALKMNVLMFGFDSLSRNAFIRKLPKSYDYLVKMLDAVVLQGYNIVGDGTPQALIPLLTGYTELELPDTRKRLKNTRYVNAYPFIWNEFKKVGYVTAFFEDVPELGTFTYRLNGFKEAPTDHYMRPYYLANLAEQYKWPKLCNGETPRHKVMFNAVRDFFSVYRTKPKFLFGFHGELSHDDYNLIGVADNDLLELLRDLNESGALNDTILILMADHGHRFADVRNTIQGKQEERLPFFAFAFPEWFARKHAAAYGNFKSNADKLTTPFDVHATLKEVLDLRNVGEADIARRSASLFTKIPRERSCSHAYIEPHWCACLDWSPVDLADPVAHKLAETLVEALNAATESHRALCEPLAISRVLRAARVAPNEALLRFNRNADVDGFVADLSAKMDAGPDLYQLEAQLVPGNSIFEATVAHFKEEGRMELKMSDVSRINAYGAQARCVRDELPDLRKYCYCKNGA